MRSHNAPPSRVRRTINDLVMVEMFLVQATIESATVIGDGLSELMSQRDDDTGEGSREPIAEVLQRIAEDAVEPYASRYKYFRDMLKADEA